MEPIKVRSWAEYIEKHPDFTGCLINEDNDIDVAWYKNGLQHREDGPAIEYFSSYKAWWLNGERHREDGPAVEYGDGRKEWWLNGDYKSEQQWKIAVRKIKLEKVLKKING